MDISEKYIEELPIDPIAACSKIIKDYKMQREVSTPTIEEMFHALAPYYAMVLELQAKIPNAEKIGQYQLITDHNQNIQRMDSYINQIEQAIRQYYINKRLNEDVQSISDLQKRFRMYLKEEFCYSFTEDEISFIQSKINELRDLITKSSYFTNEHKQRLLKRLERLQQELHKKVSDLDRFWGLIGDAGIMLGKFGKDAKPMIDTIKELTNSIWRAQARTEQIEFKEMKLFNESKD